MKEYAPIDRLWSLGLPLFFILGQIAIEIFVPLRLKPALHSEWGPHETLQAIFISIAFIVAACSAVKIDWKEQKLLGIWFVLAAICCFYVAGEEISWGQQILQWDTPEYWSTLNDQNETNLHNTSAWLDQKPRLVLFLGIAFGGLVIPALRRWKPNVLPAQFSILYPPDALIPTALGVIVPYLIQEIAEIWDFKVFHRVSELQELYMYYFVLLYLMDLRNRVFNKV
ncbi:MAG: hypothetical protein DI551_00470 [Micavibrio aeruginosavorus]|uniref:Uncharacterized protein n=1 Tax=Micavibrio aeruginosavorus TaxID=349221 RepID=A0A2W5QCK8_9BACT|nr:MAG: hypothetical protein DI551_00470 [Micavibrio aeruginosavorus]